MYTVWEVFRKYQKLTLISLETLRNRRITMDEEAWVQSDDLSGWQVKDSLRIDPRTKPQTTRHSTVPLPGSVIDYSEEVQEHPSCVIESVVEDTPEEDQFTTFGVSSAADNKATKLEECTTKKVPYIPYSLATLHIIKIVKDMQQMKNRHMKIIRKLDDMRKEKQEETITTIKKHYSEKMRCLKSHLEAYQELMNERNIHWQDTVKNLREKNRQLIQENEDILYQMKQRTENWRKEKAADEERKTDWSVEKQYLWQAHTILQEIQESLQKREREVTELLQSERRFNKAMKPQVTVLILLKSLIKMVRIWFRQR
ncbi:hypothetical protein EK904_011028 [Melospiza melodia maxima]|nr:hypothetical protein EK904_011028 [Melospiza melodia maxima]